LSTGLESVEADRLLLVGVEQVGIALVAGKRWLHLVGDGH
jgi:hypothetical protein